MEDKYQFCLFILTSEQIQITDPIFPTKLQLTPKYLQILKAHTWNNMYTSKIISLILSKVKNISFPDLDSKQITHKFKHSSTLLQNNQSEIENIELYNKLVHTDTTPEYDTYHSNYFLKVVKLISNFKLIMLYKLDFIKQSLLVKLYLTNINEILFNQQQWNQSCNRFTLQLGSKNIDVKFNNQLQKRDQGYQHNLQTWVDLNNEALMIVKPDNERLIVLMDKSKFANKISEIQISFGHWFKQNEGKLQESNQNFIEIDRLEEFMLSLKSSLGTILDRLMIQSQLLPDSITTLGVNTDVNNSIHVFGAEKNHPAIIKYVNFEIDRSEDDNLILKVNENNINVDTKTVKYPLNIIDKSSIQYPKQNIDLKIDKFDLTELNSKRSVMVKNINTFVMDMNNYKLMLNEDWKSVAKEMEIVWGNYTEDLNNCEMEYSNVCLLQSDKVKFNQKSINKDLTMFKKKRSDLNSKISEINQKLAKIKTRNLNLSKNVTDFLERVESTKIQSKNEISLNEQLDKKYLRLEDIVKEFRLVKNHSELSEKEIKAGLDQWINTYSKNKDDEDEMLDESKLDAIRLNDIIQKIKGGNSTE